MNRLRQRFRAAFKRRLATSLLPMVTLPARLALRRGGPVLILVDNTILKDGITHETGWISTGPKLWGGKIEVPTGYMARIPVHSPQNAGRVYREVRYLPGIAHLTRTGHVTLRTSAELMAERFRQPHGRFAGYGWADFNVFQGISMENVDGVHIDLNFSTEKQRRRIDSCLDPLFRAIVERLGPKSSQDAYHIFTAEKHGLFGFLHMDFRLANAIAQHANKPPFNSLKTRILLPSEFAKTIRLLPVDTNVLPLADDDQFFSTRPDLHWAQQRRQRPRKSA